MLPVSLDCFCFVCLRPVSCVPNVASVSGLFLFCLSSSCVFCTQCCQCLWIVFVLLVFVLCLVYPMLPVSLDCFCFACLRPVSCVPNVASFSGLFLFCLSSSCVLCTQCCQFLWIVFVLFVFLLCLVHPMLPVSLDCFCFVCLRPVSCVPYVASVSGLFLFCLSSSCVLCTQCCQCLWIVFVLLVFVLCLVYPMLPVSLDCFCFACLRPVSSAPNVASVSGLFLFCLSSSCVLCTQCCQCLWIVFVLFVFVLCLVYPMLPVSLDCFCFVCLRPVSCAPNVASVSGLFFVLLVFVLCLVYPMLPVSLDCFCFACLRPVSCVPNVASVSGLFLFCLSSSCVLCTQCCQCLWIVFVLFVFVLCLVYPMLPVSLDCFCFACLRPVSCAPNVASVSGLFLFCLSSSCVLCTLCCQFLWIVFVLLVFVLCLVYPMLPVSLDCFCFACLRPVSCVPYVASFSGLFFCFACLRPVSCAPNVASFSGLFLFCLSSSCVLCTQCCQCLWIVFVLFVFVLCLVYPMLPVSLDCFCFVCLRPVSCVPYVASVSGLFLFCLSSSCVLCTQCCQCLWIVFVLFVFVLCLVYPMLPVSLDCFCFVCLRPVSCVPYVASVSGLFLFCLSSSCVLCTLCCQCLWIVFVLLVFVLCLVHPMLPVSLDCFCFVCLRPVSCVPNVASVSGLFLFCLSSSCVLCTLCCQCLWIVFVLLVFVLCLVHPMLPVSLDCLFLIATSVFSNIYYLYIGQ